ncbi:MAG: hypothetical protein M1818_000695 [Claussenomyces sp. TS43310]|nr:MAG: hypothetical protein M1818_000695 [Claussenomyces sp. TS43310]
MSEPIPESIPTSQDPRSRRPTKKRALTPVSAQAATLNALFAKPDQEIPIPTAASASRAVAARAHGAAPEIVANVQGSSAGAGSGEFHVYKASRRREYERLRTMDDEVRKEEGAERFEREKREREERDREKTRKNREKREKLKARKGKGAKGGGNPAATEEKDKEGFKSGLKGPRVDGVVRREDEHMEDQAVEDAQQPGLIIHEDD